MNEAGQLTTQNIPWPDIQLDEEWAELVCDKGMGWDTNIDTPHPPTMDAQPQNALVGDSTDIHHTKPLYETVADKLPIWEQIGASDIVQSWIKDGVFFPL